MAFLEKLKDRILDAHTFLGMNKRDIKRNDNTIYLTRYYLFRKPFKWMPSLYLHCFHESDEDMELHDHPWRNSISFILSGSYREEYRDKNGCVQSRSVTPGMFNIIPANKFHRVDLETEKVWTIFLSGSKEKDWGFWNRDTGVYVGWREQEAKKLRTSILNQYRYLMNELLKARVAEGGNLSEALESSYVERLDELWWKLSETEQDILESEFGSGIGP